MLKFDWEERDFERYMSVYTGVLETPGSQWWLADIGNDVRDERALKLLADVNSRKVIS